MLRLNKNCSENRDFKQSLWLELSSKCSGGVWCYSFSEKRLFLVVLSITIFLMTIYLSGGVHDIKNLQIHIDSLDAINNKRLDELDNSSQSEDYSLFFRDNDE